MTVIRWVLYAACLLLLAIVVIQVHDGMRPIVDHGSHSTFSTDPGGTAALYRLVEETGYEVVRSQTPFEQVTEGRNVFVEVLASNPKECPT